MSKVTVVPAVVGKAEFLTPLDLRHHHKKDDGQWLVTAPLVFASKRFQCIITVENPYSSDLASVPRPPMWLMLAAASAHTSGVPHGEWLYVPVYSWMAAYSAFGGREDAAAALHDPLYEFQVFPRWKCDAIFEEASESTKAAKHHERRLVMMQREIESWTIVHGMWAGVRLGGWSHYRKRKRK